MVTIYVVGEVDSEGSSSTHSSGVQAELRQAVQLAMEQQRQLVTLNYVAQQQNNYISRLSQRDVTLGLELRPTSIYGSDAPTGDSPTTSAAPAATGNVLLAPANAVCLSVCLRVCVSCSGFNF